MTEDTQSDGLRSGDNSSVEGQTAEKLRNSSKDTSTGSLTDDILRDSSKDISTGSRTDDMTAWWIAKSKNTIEWEKYDQTQIHKVMQDSAELCERLIVRLSLIKNLKNNHINLGLKDYEDRRFILRNYDGG